MNIFSTLFLFLIPICSYLISYLFLAVVDKVRIKNKLNKSLNIVFAFLNQSKITMISGFSFPKIQKISCDFGTYASRYPVIPETTGPVGVDGGAHAWTQFFVVVKWRPLLDFPRWRQDIAWIILTTELYLNPLSTIVHGFFFLS